MNEPLCCQFSLCTKSATHRCATCDLWTCGEHFDHGPDGNGPHIAAGTEAAEIVSLRAQLAEEQDSNQARLDYTEELQDQCRKVAIALHECGIEVDDFGEDLKIADGVQTLCDKLTKSEEETAFERGALQVAATDLHNSERERDALRDAVVKYRRIKMRVTKTGREEAERGVELYEAGKLVDALAAAAAEEPCSECGEHYHVPFACPAPAEETET